jgi:putative serine protease PepD
MSRILPMEQLHVRPAGRSPWAVGFVSAIGGVLLAGSLMFGVGGVGDEPARLALRPIATLAPRITSVVATIDPNPAGDRPYVVGVDVATVDEVRSGSGLVVRSDGHVATTATLVAGATDLRITLADGTVYPGAIVGTDALNDLAVIKISAANPLPVTPLATADTATSASDVLVVGPSRGVRAPAWKATVTSIDARLSAGSCDLHGAIQLAATLEPSATGSAVLDQSEVVIGLATTTGADRSGTTVAVPARTVRTVSEQLIAAGVVRHGWLGVEGITASSDQSQTAGSRGGAAVRRVLENSPAVAAGLAADDVIIAVGGEVVPTMSHLVVVVREHRPGDVVSVEFARGGEHRRADVVLGEPAKV